MTNRYMVELFDETQLWTLQQRLRRLSVVDLWLFNMMHDAPATADNQARWARVMRTVGLGDMARDLEAIDLGECSYATGNDALGLFQQREVRPWDSGAEMIPASMQRKDVTGVCSGVLLTDSIIDRLARTLKESL